MELKVIFLLLTAAIFHSIWNTLIKKSLDKQVSIWLSLITFSVIFLVPFCVTVKSITFTGCVYILLSGLLEALYFYFIGRAYQQGDLSLVYPLSRGLAPVFVTIIACSALKEAISWIGFCGILSIVIGIYVINVQMLDREGFLAPFFAVKQKESIFAILAGLSTAGYTTLDKAGIRYVDPAVLMYLKLFVAAFCLLPYMIVKKRDYIVREWKVNRLKIIVVAILLASAYFLVLIAMTTSKVSYVSAVREISIVFAGIIGSFYLHEKFAGKKILGSLLIFAGIIFIAMSKV